jgi:membrane protein required for colicin V production
LTADLVVVAIVALSALFAFVRGFVREVLSVAAWVVAILAAIFGFPFLRPVVGRYISITPVADAATAIAIFLVVLVVASIISHLLSRNVKTSSFSALDRSLGLLFGIARGALVVCALFLLVDWFFPPDERPAWVVPARTLTIVSAGAGMLKDMVKNLLPEGTLEKGKNAADSAKQQVNQAIAAGQATGVIPTAQPAPATASDNADSAGPAKDSGYKDAERKDLNRLIQTQGAQ